MTSEVRGYLGALAKHLHLATPDEREILHEIRDHIEDSANDLIDEGIPSDDAFTYVINDLDDSRNIARNLYTVHSRGSWHHTALAVLPHILLSLMFALGLWRAPGWLFLALVAATTISVFGWKKGRSTWTYPWLGYCLVAPIVSWGLAMSAVGYGAWGVVTRGVLPLDVPIYIVSFVYIAVSLWVVVRIVSRVAQRDWVIASLTVMPVPFLGYWFLFFYGQKEMVISSSYRQGVDASATIVFLLLAIATAAFFRIGHRIARVALLFITVPSMCVLAWMSYQGGPGYLAVFTLSAMSLAVLLGPALLDHAPRRREKRLATVEEIG